MLDHLEEMLQQIKENKAQLFDVREKGEWDAGHLKLAHLVALSNIMEGKLPEGINKTLPTYLHCRSGHRVQTAAPLLADLGFKNVIPLSEGFQELIDEGLEAG